MPERATVAVTGASGLVGKALTQALNRGGYGVKTLVRRAPAGTAEIRWDPAAGSIDSDGLRGVDALVHLAGENVAAGRWTNEHKARIRDSRVEGTALLARTLARMKDGPRNWISASAVGFYGDRGSEAVDESSAPGTGFLASVCRDWEAATAPAAEAGVRVVLARIGIVLSPEGGALAKMKPAFQLGLGGRIGDGSQFMSWISLEDLVSALIFLVEHSAISGAVNCVAPAPVSNADFTETLARTLKRPAMIPVPKFALRLAAGSEMANEMLIGGARVVPAVLLDQGFRWAQPTLGPALAAMLRRDRAR